MPPNERKQAVNVFTNTSSGRQNDTIHWAKFVPLRLTILPTADDGDRVGSFVAND